MMTGDNRTQMISRGLAPDVRVIEKQQEAGTQISVAAYCRVSTNLEVQKQSLETQMAAFQKTISEHPGWVLAGIYADKGISGTSVKRREEFLRMIEDAKAGKIQYILVKSISRFSRNTVDALRYVRELKNYGVSVFFDKEQLDTGNATSEFLLSILAASAQEEIISLSNNMKVGRRMRFAAGSTQWTHVYGYRKGENDEWLIEESEAEIIRRIFREYLEGRSLPEICRDLQAEGIPSIGGKTVWFPKSVAEMIQNERYIGDIRMQKSYISDPINHIRVDNRDARLKQYYKENHHPAIIDKETYQVANTIAAMKNRRRGIVQYPYYGFLKCPICGSNMVRIGLPRNIRTFIWTCGGEHNPDSALRKDRTACPPYCIHEPYIDEAFADALHEAASQGVEDVSAESLLKLAADIKEGKKSVEYKMLYDLVDRISFPKWSVMRVIWKNGRKTDVQINYRQMADVPYPEFSVEMEERRRKDGSRYMGKVFFINGVRVKNKSAANQIDGIMHAQEEVMLLTILEPKDYEPQVPRVLGQRTVNKDGDTELVEANRMKLKKYREKDQEKE